MKRFVFGAVVCAALSTTAFAYTITGSRTMYALNVALTAKYRTEHPAVAFTVSDAGTGAGIEKLIDGSTDVAAVTRRLRPNEVEAMRKHAHSDGVFVPVAREGISIYLHPQNHVEGLTVEQISAIFSGRITNWKELGGADLPIHLYAFDNTTGRYWYLAEEVMKKEKFAAGVVYTAPKPAGAKNDAEGLAMKEAQMLKWISSDPAAIGFGDLKKIRVVKLAKIYNGGEAFWPTPDAIASGKYPLQRTLGYLFRSAPQGELRSFVEWAAKEEETIRQYGFVPAK